jgi:flagellar motor switch protein FliM
VINIRLLVQVILLIAQGIFEALRSAQKFEELEERMQRLVQRAALILLEEAFNQIGVAPVLWTPWSFNFTLLQPVSPYTTSLSVKLK